MERLFDHHPDQAMACRELTPAELHRALDDAQQERKRLLGQLAAKDEAIRLVIADRDRAELHGRIAERRAHDELLAAHRGAEEWHATQAAVHAEELKRHRSMATDVQDQLRAELRMARAYRTQAEQAMGDLLGNLRAAAAKIKGREARRAARPLLDYIPKPEQAPF